MSARRVLCTCVLTLLSLVWIYKDSLGSLCPGVSSGCVQSSVVPCGAGAGTCVPTQGAATLGGIFMCDANTAAVQYTAIPATAWTDCQPKTGYGPCQRSAQTCETVYLYAAASDCALDLPCLSVPVQDCKSNSNQPNC